MKLLVVTTQPGQSAPYIRAACKSGWQVSCECSYQQLATVLTGLQADAALLVAEHVDEAIVKAIRLLGSHCPMPVALFTDDARPLSMRAAVAAGAAAYVVDCHDVNRVGALLEVAIIRFNASQELKKELHKAKTTLAERNTVEKAKGIIMRQRKVNEDTAYQLLRKLSMDRNRRIGEVAGEVIAAADVLI